jgi:hypothetical protein
LPGSSVQPSEDDKNDQGGFNMARIAQEWRTRFLGLKLKARVPEVMVVLRAAHGGLWMFLLFDFTTRYQIYEVKANLGAAVVAVVLWFSCDCVLQRASLFLNPWRR